MLICELLQYIFYKCLSILISFPFIMYHLIIHCIQIAHGAKQNCSIQFNMITRAMNSTDILLTDTPVSSGFVECLFPFLGLWGD